MIENLLSVQLRIQSAGLIQDEVNDIDSSKNEIDNGREKWLDALLETIKNILDIFSPKPPSKFTLEKLPRQNSLVRSLN